ncbi:sigma-70 family RNA polymerase sigma factor [Enterovibrio norvegicus]|uniref:sigma-70 family RNA polymerase sigma factor n=1 Tax=Enterovibrio norvegicus TaxID=188144 RepID=UPI0002FC8B7B|nr:sigma-70 family RNA polymerase sigma factor [Enterovibrio norvegicus]OEE69277.1 RNA polymerase subunit sigma-24 [Enterovibrio norvegicus]PMH70372.1 RNA polymerase subunit sigma-24 [Enterovibrio norvegicus]PMI25640.1 RNA polymerase subunit sigma-24 [Enterovibrio norvegicus]TKF17972.1 sigma-70 family RNA polymerase sigma factor [Enterovibrio norvegicus]TKF33984.1 sigma-70 family RNA polymerase sigma factor [Enterovibrio norvegicus]
MENIPDEQLMLQFRDGNQAAFATLYQRHKGSLYRYFLRQLGAGNGGRVEELYQDVWYRVIDKRESYVTSAKFTTWLYHIAHHLVIDEHRKRLSENAYASQLPDEPQSNMNDAEAREKDAIKVCMDTLAPLQREAFLLRHEAGFEPAQICEIVDAKPEAVKTRLRYAMEQLRQCLTRKLGGRE